MSPQLKDSLLQTSVNEKDGSKLKENYAAHNKGLNIPHTC